MTVYTLTMQLSPVSSSLMEEKVLCIFILVYVLPLASGYELKFTYNTVIVMMS